MDVVVVDDEAERPPLQQLRHPRTPARDRTVGRRRQETVDVGQELGVLDEEPGTNERCAPPQCSLAATSRANT